METPTRPTSPHPRRIIINDIVFSPDEELLYCYFAEGLIRIWNLSTKGTIEETCQEILESVQFPQTAVTLPLSALVPFCCMSAKHLERLCNAC